jgi:hypothetical protein
VKKLALIGILIVSVFCIFANVGGHLTSSADVRTHESWASNVVMTIDYGNSTQSVFSNLTGNTVFEIINETASVSFTQFAFGRFITAINDVENDANGNGYFWQYWVNDELAPVAADNYVLSDGDQVLWKYCAPETTPSTPPNPGPELFLGLGIIIVVGIILVVASIIVYLRIR